MTITHAGFAVPGLQQEFRIGQWDEQSQILSLFGSPGGIKQLGGLTTRTITVPIWVYGGYASSSSLEAFVRSLDNRIGAEGSLVETTGPLLRTFTNCVWETVIRQSELLPPNPHIGWSIELELTFRQMTPG